MNFNRREFLRSAGAAAIAPWRMWSGAGSADAVLVVVNLYGGNDGLNTVVPIGDAQYALYERLRPTLKIPREHVLRLSGQDQPNGPYGLNPVMIGLRDLYEAGHAAIVAGVGVPRDAESMFDHAAGVYDFVSADPYHLHFHSARPTGWLGRAIDDAPAASIPVGLDFGGGSLLLTGAARRPLSLGALSEFQLYAGDEALRAYRDIMEIPRPDAPIAELNRSLRKGAIDNGNVLRERTRGYRPLVEYPRDNPLGDSLRDIAAVIWARLGARGFSVALGGFDTHKNQGVTYFHHSLLKTFSDAVAAFYNDLRAQGLSRNVVILTVSDFGRRPEENVDRGTDHGYANCCFVIGDAVKKGIWGIYPSLESSKLVFDQNLDMTVDYRAVYATILARHFDLDPQPLVGVGQTLGFM
ncbi:MAG: DUF1501 domain-containing protein [Blastocatellia bacterium]|nr:DUF1501 domain-containing protein [Blastocatellia bacterium]